jgi:hypothetical protein
MAEEIKQLQALLDEFDNESVMEEGGLGDRESSQQSNEAETETGGGPHKNMVDPSPNRTVKLKYGSLIKTIEASSRTSSSQNSKPVSTNNTTSNSNSSSSTTDESTENRTFCKNCLRLMFTILYLIYTKAWIIINTTVVFIVIFICYSIK